LTNSDYPVLTGAAELYSVAQSGTETYIQDVNSIFELSGTLEPEEVRMYIMK
jgi:hypothetical protein